MKKKITFKIEEEILKTAMKACGKNISNTIRLALESVAANPSCAKFFKSTK